MAPLESLHVDLDAQSAYLEPGIWKATSPWSIIFDGISTQSAPFPPLQGLGHPAGQAQVRTTTLEMCLSGQTKPHTLCFWERMVSWLPGKHMIFPLLQLVLDISLM